MVDVGLTLLAAVGWAALHILWQAMLMALLYAVARRTLSLTPAARYRLGLAALCSLLLLGSATGLAALTRPGLPRDRAAAAVQPPMTATGAVEAPTTTQDSHQARRVASSTPLIDEGFLRVIGAAWLLLAIVSAAAAGGVRLLLGRQCRLATPLPAKLQSRAARLIDRLALQEPVRMLQAGSVRQPMLFGIRRPVVLMPAWLIRDLPTRHVEALLAHELAHIRRRDYLVNLAQVVAETFLLRHPAVLWVSRQIRRDREVCCDALAAQAVGSCRLVAEALARLEQRNSGPFHLAPAATEGDLVHRVRRLLAPAEQVQHRPSRLRTLAGGCALALVPMLALPVTFPSPLRSFAAAPAHRLVLGGVDPVALLRDERIVGVPAHERVHDGFLYRFASEANAASFEAHPSDYAVVNIDACPVTGKPVRADVFEVIDGRVYLFCCDNASEIPRPALEAIVRAGGLDELLRSGGAVEQRTPRGRQIVILESS